MRNRELISAGIKLIVFIVVTSLATSLLVITIGNLTFGAQREYKAQFTDATGVVKGDDVRVAGVKVGVVKDIQVVNSTLAEVTFTVAEATPVTAGTEVEIRYRNLVGQRYLSLSQGIGGTDRLAIGDTIPTDRTSPALDLTVLFNGFKPLFRALSPAELNQLSGEIIQVFQGEAGTVESLLASTASVTTDLANRDQLIGDLITNLNQVLETVSNRDEELSDLIINFRRLVSGLRDDREPLLASLDGISALSVETADLVSGIRPPLVDDIREIRRLATNLDRPRDTAEIDRALTVLPIKLRKIGRTAVYGSYFNFYLCNFQGRIDLSALPKPIRQLLGINRNLQLQYPLPGTDLGPRCDLG
ncbi:MCE family protein [Nocardioides sp. CFH 31398]|uniref:MCE family protein n=1 Tax=Nocardioides sp. CFH 31398 TaxID=2919579 RepID=UPI001F05BDAB|nr:MCE family protein [Nocardioides sp. CFH 31398]MCH1865237.1 MCE family protein [Nocardioides sp. CFH 31398]